MLGVSARAAASPFRLLAVLAAAAFAACSAFVAPSISLTRPIPSSSSSSSSSTILPFRTTTTTARRQQQQARRRLPPINMVKNKDGSGDDEGPIFYNDFEGFFENGNDDSNSSFRANRDKNSNSHNNGDEYDDDDDELMLDADALGDWRAVRQKLLSADNFATQQEQQQPQTNKSNNQKKKSVSRSSRQNEQLLERQNRQLAREYKTSVWAHETSTPEVGGLLVRMPLEVELRRNYRHSRTGEKLRYLMESRHVDQSSSAKSDSSSSDDDPTKARRQALENIDTSIWYHTAQTLIEDEMMKIADKAAEDGQIDASILNDDASEVLQLYLDQQETWQEVALVLELDERQKTATTVVINRPMALQLTDSLGKLVLHGSFLRPTQPPPPVSMKDFLRAFGSECAVYVGGPDLQNEPAILVHGIAGLEGATEIAPGIYRGGLPAAVRGVLAGRYRPLDFRFFVGRHVYSPQPRAVSPTSASASSSPLSSENSHSAATLDLVVHLGKYQPVACARALALKQCIQLPKPLWHEVLELCGGDLARISKLELAKRDDLGFQIVSEDDDDDIEEEDDAILQGLDDDEYDIIVLDEGDEYDDDDDDDE